MLHSSIVVCVCVHDHVHVFYQIDVVYNVLQNIYKALNGVGRILGKGSLKCVEKLSTTPT